MFTNFFKQVNINPANVNILNGNATDLTNECEEYELKIKMAGGIELFIGGIGPDGNITYLKLLIFN